MPAGFMTYKPAENLPSNAFAAASRNFPKHKQEGQTCVSCAVAHVCECFYHKVISDKLITDFHRRCVEYGSLTRPRYFYYKDCGPTCKALQDAQCPCWTCSPNRVYYSKCWNNVDCCQNYGGKCLYQNCSCPSPNSDARCSLDQEMNSIPIVVSCLAQFHVIESCYYYISHQFDLLKYAVGRGNNCIQPKPGYAYPIAVMLKVYGKNMRSPRRSFRGRPLHCWDIPSINDDLPCGNHAVAVVGYYDLTDRDKQTIKTCYKVVDGKDLDDGFFVVKNSWSTNCDNYPFECLWENWIGNEDGCTLGELLEEGYDFIPYEYVRQCSVDAMGMIPFEKQSVKASAKKWLTFDPTHLKKAEYKLENGEKLKIDVKHLKQWNTHVYRPEFGVKRVWEAFENELDFKQIASRIRLIPMPDIP